MADLSSVPSRAVPFSKYGSAHPQSRYGSKLKTRESGRAHVLNSLAKYSKSCRKGYNFLLTLPRDMCNYFSTCQPPKGSPFVLRYRQNRFNENLFIKNTDIFELTFGNRLLNH